MRRNLAAAVLPAAVLVGGAGCSKRADVPEAKPDAAAQRAAVRAYLDAAHKYRDQVAAGASMEDALKADAEASRLGGKAREAKADGPALEAVRKVEAAVKAYEELAVGRDSDKMVKGAIDRAAKETGVPATELAPASMPAEGAADTEKAAELMRAADAAVAGLK